VLGTAQWGAPYGVTNSGGRVSDEEIAAIVGVAEASGIVSADTAAGYGNAQTRLRPWSERFEITTKVAGADSGEIVRNLEKCLAELGVGQVKALLIHDWEELEATSHVEVAAQLRMALSDGLVTDVGVSVYRESGIESAAKVFQLAGIPLAVVQIPVNALDRRMESSRGLLRAVEEGTRTQVRSVLLQGLLAGPSDADLASHPNVRAFHQYAADVDLSPVAAALAHVRSLPWADQIVVGVTTADELREIVEAWNSCEPMQAPAHLASKDLELIDPRRW